MPTMTTVVSTATMPITAGHRGEHGHHADHRDDHAEHRGDHDNHRT
jgi:hypothetical protein